jgi:hypothetical protein
MLRPEDPMSILKKAIVAIMPLVAGCVVYYDPPRRHYYYSPPQPPAGTTLVVDSEADEVHDVVYREYFGCSEAEIAFFPHYRHYYGLTDDDLYFLYFTSLQCSVSFDVCFHAYYYDCGRSYDRLVVYYQVPRERYFVAIGPGVTPPPVYARTYAVYRSGSYASVTFSNQEYVALVHMKVGCEYQGHPPATYFARVQATGSTSRVIVESRDRCGQGGRTATGARVATTAPRPWTMPPQQKQQWRQERQASATKSEAAFRGKHQEQVTKIDREKPQPPKTEREPRHAGPPARPNGQERPDSNPPHRPGERPDQGPGEPPPPPKHREPPPEHPKGGEKPRSDDRGDKKDK